MSICSFEPSAATEELAARTIFSSVSVAFAVAMLLYVSPARLPLVVKGMSKETLASGASLVPTTRMPVTVAGLVVVQIADGLPKAPLLASFGSPFSEAGAASV